jgi:hypothetical protein
VPVIVGQGDDVPSRWVRQINRVGVIADAIIDPAAARLIGAPYHDRAGGRDRLQVRTARQRHGVREEQ